MRKGLLWIALASASAMLVACTTDSEQQSPLQQAQQPVWNGPVVEISGAEPRYEPFNPATSQNYSVNGNSYKVIQDPSRFTQTGLASSYGEENNGNRTATGEEFDANAMAAAHPTLPLPSYVRVTNLANGRMIVVRVNDRGPYTPGRIIDLTRAAADRLNISNNTRVKLDYIAVAPDGSLSGPGTLGTTIAKQTYALPARPDISGGMTSMGAAESSSAPPTAAPQDIQPVDNSTLSGGNSMGAPVRSNGFLGAAQPLPSGILEGSDATTADAATTTAPAVAARTAPVAAASRSGNWLVQVGALRDETRARQMASSLGNKFGVTGAVSKGDNVYRVQLGPFNSRQQAAAFHQRLLSEAQQQSFITIAPGAE